MRQTPSGRWIAQPGDRPETIFKHWEDFVPFRAELDDEAGDEFMFGGVVYDENGQKQELESFESVGDARTFCVEVLRIPAARISVVEG